MFSFKKSLLALVGIVVIANAFALLMPRVSRGQAQGQTPFAPRQYYLTKTFYNGSQALSACEAGYHMASLWEIFDTSNLHYNTQLGHTQADSGFGPPSAAGGWIRTGANMAFESTEPGTVHCNAWTSSDEHDYGTITRLASSWFTNPVKPVNPWEGFVSTCNGTLPVWCVQD